MKDKRLTVHQRRNLLAAVCSCVVFLGAAAIGSMLILSETLFYDTEAFSLLPPWYKATMLIGALAAFAGLAGCLFTKNKLNTSRTEMKVNLCLFLSGFLISLIFALLPTETRWTAIMIGIGGAICTVGFFSSIASLIGVMKKSKSQYAELLQAYTRDRKTPYWKLPSASLADVMEAEGYFGTLLPGDLVNFLLEFDGDGEFLYSAREIIETTRLLRGNPSYQNLCFIGQDGEGNNFCYRIQDDGSICDECIYLCRNPEEIIPVADDLRELIDKYYGGSLGDEDIAAWQQSNAYNKFIEWWSNVDEKSIENDEQLVGAYRLMWYYNEVSNGGFDQFWDFADNAEWDLEQLRKTFETLLPEDQFLYFEAALGTHMDGKDCEAYNAHFDYDGFANTILPQIAESVVNILEQRGNTD
ncbi:MAG: SMI1/KNR4 family protein [Christensenellales bacterium]